MIIFNQLRKISVWGLEYGRKCYTIDRITFIKLQKWQSG